MRQVSNIIHFVVQALQVNQVPMDNQDNPVCQEPQAVQVSQEAPVSQVRYN